VYPTLLTAQVPSSGATGQADERKLTQIICSIESIKQKQQSLREYSVA
jgi:hypothetical protein